MFCSTPGIPKIWHIEIYLIFVLQDKPVTWRLLGIASFFVLVKVTSSYFSGANSLLLHAANGGLMQVLWNWKEIQKLDGAKSSSDGTSNPVHVVY